MTSDSISATASVGRVSIWFSATRPRTLTAAVVPVIVGISLAYRVGHVNLLAAIATLAAAVLIQIGTNLANDYYDFVNGADTEARLGPLRITQAKLVEPSQVKNAAYFVLGAAGALGLYLVYIGGWPILLIGALSILAAVAYSAGPYPLAHNGLGDLFVFIFFGLIAVNGTVFLQIGRVTALSLLSSIPIACLVTAILVVNNLRDIETDRLARKRTLAARFGAPFTRAWYVVLVAIAFITVPLLASVGGPSFLLPLCAIPVAYREIQALRQRSGTALNQSLGGTAALHLIYGVLLAIGIVA